MDIFNNILMGFLVIMLCIFGPALIGMIFAEDKSDLGECWASGFVAMMVIVTFLGVCLVVGGLVNAIR